MNMQVDLVYLVCAAIVALSFGYTWGLRTSRTLAYWDAADFARAAQDVINDMAQDALEDPVGHADFKAGGFCRIGMGAINAVRSALLRYAQAMGDGK